MGCGVHQWGWFVDAQESRIQAKKLSEMGYDDPQRGWFADAQESRIQFVRRSDADWMDFDLPMLRNRVFRYWNVHVCAVPSYEVVDLLVFRN